MDEVIIPPVPDRFNIIEELLERHIRQGRQDNPAIWYPDRTTGEPRVVSYGSLYETVNRVGNAIRPILSKGDRLGILLPDSPDVHYLFLAALKIGAVPVPMSTFAPRETVIRMVAKGEMKALVSDRELLEKVKGIEKEAPTLEKVIASEPMDGYATLDQLTRSASPRLTAADTSKDDVAFWFYTSGSTGDPKGVVHTHFHIHHAAYSNYNYWIKITPTDKIFSAAKLFFSAGLGPGLYAPLTFGASSVLFPGRINAEVCYDVVTKFKPTMLFAVPTVFAKMLQVSEAEKKYDIRSLRLCLTGGEPLPPMVYNEWVKRTGVELVEGVGAAEMTHHFLFNPVGRVRPGSGGKLLPGFQARLLDARGNEVPTNQIGELFLKGPSSLLYYWKDEEKTKKTISEDGWVKLGDLFRVDEDGYFYFCGRMDFAFKVSGMWVSPIKLESILLKDPAVLECCVVPYTRPDGIAVPIAFVVLKKGFSPSAETEAHLKEQFAGKVARFETPQIIRFVESLPKTTVDKIDRKALLQIVSESGISA